LTEARPEQTDFVGAPMDPTARSSSPRPLAAVVQLAAERATAQQGMTELVAVDGSQRMAASVVPAAELVAEDMRHIVAEHMLAAAQVQSERVVHWHKAQ
jgi:hypothetical protein